MKIERYIDPFLSFVSHQQVRGFNITPFFSNLHCQLSISPSL